MMLSFDGKCPNRKRPFYEHYILISCVERSGLTVVSALAAINNPLRGDMVATLGEIIGTLFLKRMRDTMLASKADRQILQDRPSINASSLDFDQLRLECAPGTFGHAYISWLDEQGVTPDTREPVRLMATTNHAGIFYDTNYRQPPDDLRLPFGDPYVEYSCCYGDAKCEGEARNHFDISCDLS
ncbi:Coq4-domain-containing protein [Hesseltinella vesiculosa]|uniref:Coq4-domain-containing protein n=1 Tax=Hesseltinella vesiculosa TaxID=101127 RepID=A0A1X2GFB0_9FUNG|nr:Coq4-domain-containing protein [Hesseltinella vesiculosa]